MSAKNFTYTLKIDAEVKDLVAKTKLVKDNMSSLTATGAPEIEKAFGAIEKALTKL